MPYITVDSNNKVTLGSMVQTSDDQILYEGEIPNYNYLVMEGGVLIKDTEYLEIDKINHLEVARTERKIQLAALDLYDKAVIIGDISQSESDKAARNAFRAAWLSITNDYTDASLDIKSLYPDIPAAIAYFL